MRIGILYHIVRYKDRLNSAAIQNILRAATQFADCYLIGLEWYRPDP